jgi:hypothetical protein
MGRYGSGAPRKFPELELSWSEEMPERPISAKERNIAIHMSKRCA